MNSRKRSRRRRFLQQSALGAVIGSGAWASGAKLSLIGSALAARSDYAALVEPKALVCIFLSGGCDTFSLTVPAEAPRYARYAAQRGALSVDSQALLYAGSEAQRVGFNPALTGLHRLYSEGDLAIVQNVGNLLAPTTRADYLARRPWLPPHLFTHDHQRLLLDGASALQAPGRAGSGWGGRMADLLEEANGNEKLPLGFSLSGNSQWLTGLDSLPLALAADGLPRLDYLDRSAGLSGSSRRETTLGKILALQRSNALKEQVSVDFSRARERSHELNAVLDNSKPGAADTAGVSQSLERSLQMVARLIADRDSLQMKRQLFFVQHNGWDTHTNQRSRMATLLAELDQALSSFQHSLRERGLDQSVTTFTTTEFARALTVNSSGTDHGWGGQALILGAQVAGGRLHGSAPSLRIGGNDDAGSKGRFIPSTSINQLGAALAQWFGLTQSDIAEVFPDLHNFNDRGRLNLFAG